MNAYVVLARLTAQPAPSPEDLTLSMSTIMWLTKQQNSNGGFSSTQDTVVALDALSKYGAVTFEKSENDFGDYPIYRVIFPKVPSGEQ